MAVSRVSDAPGRLLAPLAWLAGGVSVGLALTSLVMLAAGARLGPNGLVSLVTGAAIGACGALLAVKQPRNLIGWLFCFVGVTQSLDVFAGTYARYGLAHGAALAGEDIMSWLNAWMWIPGLAILATVVLQLFPDGRPLSRRWAWLAWASVLLAALAMTGVAVLSWPLRGVDLTLHVSGPPAGAPRPVAEVAVGLFIACIIASVVSVFLRFRRAAPDTRLQLKWVAYGFVILAVLAATAFIPNEIPLFNLFVKPAMVLLFVASLGISVMKYGLYNIDIVISRTLVYGALALFISAVYITIVVGAGTLVGSGGKPNLLLSIVATAVVAVAFQPVRERLQKLANRLVYGRRATPYEVLSEFSQRVSESYAGEQVLPRMAEVLAAGTAAERADVWLRTGEQLRPAASWPSNGHDVGMGGPTIQVIAQGLPALPDADRAVAVRHQGELLGALTVKKRAGESLTPIEEKLLDDLAHQAGLVLKNVGLTSDLQARLDDLRASRQRLVAAQDQERRRLERNLHDGAQQNLVALKVKLGLAEKLAAKDPARARTLVGELKADADEALETLRDLARGIYPPLLADQGLVAALQAQARKATVPVSIEATGIARYPQETEAAVYFCCLEGLQNVQKYAQATRATVRLVDTGDELSFEVVDDGVGFDPGRAARGAGLQNMADRIDALGGSLTVVAAPGQGVRVKAVLPALAPVRTS